MNTSVKKMWVKALRSGEYKQGQARLCTVRDGERHFCCLGVLCDLHRKLFHKGDWEIEFDDGAPYGYGYGTGKYLKATSFVPRDVAEWAGLNGVDPKVNGNRLSSHNDGGPNCYGSDNEGVLLKKKDFNQIADLIEEHL